MDNKTSRQLHEAMEYAENIVSTIREPLLVLDSGLLIISANQSFYRLFTTTPLETVGKLIYEVDNGQWNVPQLRNLLENILPKNTSFDNFEVDHEFSRLGRRTMILNARRVHDGSAKSNKILLAIEDVTERRKMEHEIDSSELRYRRLFETAQDGILILDSQAGEITDVNPFLTDMLGYSKQELLGKKLWEIGFFKDSAASHQAFRILQDKGYVRYEDLPLETKDGRPMEVEFVSNVYAIDGEKVIQCNIRDITERKLAEKELNDKNQKLISVLQSISDGFMALDNNLVLTYFNKSAEDLLGRKTEDVINRKLFDSFPEAKGSIFEQKYTQAINDKKPVVFETYFGVEPYQNWYDVRVYPYENGIAVYFQVTTERKNSEERVKTQYSILKSIIESPNTPIFSIDSNYCYTSFNSHHATTMKTLYGANIEIGKNMLDYISVSLDKNIAKANLDNALNGKYSIAEAFSGTEISRRYFQVSHNPIVDIDGIIIGVSVFARDLTDRKQAEEKISKLNESLKEHMAEIETANQELEAFSYTASHDLQAPLRAMNGFSKAVLEDYTDKLDEQGKDYLRRIGEASERMSQMINSMLNLSRLVRNEIQKEQVNLSDLAGLVINDLLSTDPVRKTEINIMPGLNTVGDKKLLYIVLENLLGNAWKFTSHKKDAKIQFGMTEQNGKPAYFVRDNGVGFNMTYANQLFKPFNRLHSSTEFAGTGIGLASVQRIIKRHGGNVWAESEINKGATFYFTLG